MTFRIAHEQDGSHRYTMATGKLLGRSTAGEGAVEEIDTATLLGVYVLKAGDTMTGNLGIGPTTSAWASGYKALELGRVGNAIFASASASQTLVVTNAYWNGTNWKYANTDGASQFELGSSGGWNFYNAASGTAGNNISFVLRAAISAAGNFGLNITPSAWGSPKVGLDISQAGASLVGDSGATKNISLITNAYYDGAAWKAVATGQSGATDMAMGGFTVYHNASATAGNAPTWTAVAAISKGNSLALEGATVQAGTGITFPATQSASSHANTLDDYEEGTWTPSSGTTNVTVTEQATAVYTKVGRQVTATCYVAIVNNTGANVYSFQLNGLPFAMIAAYYGAGTVHYNSSGLTPITGCYVQAGNSYALVSWGNPPLAASGTAYLMMTFTYFV